MDAQEQVRRIYDKFKSLHANSIEAYEPTGANVLRWQWHIDQAKDRPLQYEQYVISGRFDAELLANERRYGEFSQMPPYMRDKYLKISEIFPGVQFYACGSRVTGGYIDKFCGDAIVDMRKALGKNTAKVESDYDVWVDFKKYSKISIEEMRKALPLWADIVHAVPPYEKVIIPMWNFDLLPDIEHENVLQLFNEQNWGELMAIHNKYKLSPNHYCCDAGPVRRWFEWGINQGHIKNEGANNKLVE
jgi:hypothetical protein